jgi:glycosyltransferase involved in cell wall biosynthesis
VHVHIVDPSAYTPPYDDALCRALAAAGANVDLYTSAFAYGAVPAADDYTRHEDFYRLAHRTTLSGARGRASLVLKLAEHAPDMLRYRRRARTADIVHFQWLTVQPLDLHLLPARRPDGRLVLTAHDIMPREPRRGQLAAQRRLYDRFDAIVTHSEHGRARLTGELGMDDRRVHVIPHGVLRPWAGVDESEDPPAGLLAEFTQTTKPVVLFFGLLRPYKGVDVLLDAWRRAQPNLDGELWIAGMPRMDMSLLRASAPPSVRFFTEFVSDASLHWLLRRANLVVLPYRDIDASGAALTALGAGVPLLLSDAGAFPELAATGAARVVGSGDSVTLAQALVELLADPETLRTMGQRADEAAAGPYAWEHIGAQTLALYETLLSDNSRS